MMWERHYTDGATKREGREATRGAPVLTPGTGISALSAADSERLPRGVLAGTWRVLPGRAGGHHAPHLVPSTLAQTALLGPRPGRHSGAAHRQQRAHHPPGRTWPRPRGPPLPRPRARLPAASP